MNLDHFCLLNTQAYQLAVVRSVKAVLDLDAMSDILCLLQVNPTMASGELRSFLVRHLPSHLSLSSKYIGNFCAKAIEYLSVNVLKQITDEVASQLHSSSTTEEHIASDSSID